MSMFRAKKLDLGCFTKIRTIRDHTKRKVFEEFETERYGLVAKSPLGSLFPLKIMPTNGEASVQARKKLDAGVSQS